MSQQALLTSTGQAGVAGTALYVEDVFSTYLYTGNGSTQTITNGIDLATEGGLIWAKIRDTSLTNHELFDTTRGISNMLESDTTNAEQSRPTAITAVNADGFSLGSGVANLSGYTYASWTFRKAPKFFDVVTYTGNGTAGRTVAHSLGSVPGCIIVKRTDTTNNWFVYHRSIDASAPESYLIYLNLTNARASTSSTWNNTAPTDSVFTLGDASGVNASGGTYVAYLFAHNAGGFGDANDQNVISCGSFTTDGSGNATVNLGWEPQWFMVKNATTASNQEWRIVDNMRGFTVDSGSAVLTANSSDAEFTSGTLDYFNNGFYIDGLANSATFIYIAIRRGPMKTPSDATTVFSPILTSATTDTKLTTNFPIDAQIYGWTGGPYSNVVDRLRGVSSTDENYSTLYLQTSTTAGEASSTGITNAFDNTGFKMLAGYSGYSTIFWSFRRAPGFFDVVCYTGTGVTDRVLAHNLGVYPELIIIKKRNTTGSWFTVAPVVLPYGYSGTGAAPTELPFMYLDTTDQAFNSSGIKTISTSQLTFSTSTIVNGSGTDYVAYLFATVAGVSKIGSYTGTATTLQIDCGFTSGARFVLIKRVDNTGDWYVWDSARGIVAGDDPYLLLNSTAAEVTSTDYVDTYSAGFEISSTAPAAINASGGTFIYLAIA